LLETVMIEVLESEDIEDVDGDIVGDVFLGF
jgi:hypothetical protein